MITTVTGKHQVTIPAKLATALGIVPGSKLDWAPGEEPGSLRVRVIPDRRTLANALFGAGQRLRAETTQSSP